jgi:hypothetical protein
MFFPRNALASGPQACFSAGKRIAKVKVGKTKEPLPFLAFLVEYLELVLK